MALSQNDIDYLDENFRRIREGIYLLLQDRPNIGNSLYSEIVAYLSDPEWKHNKWNLD